MILKASQRGGPRQLAAHLMNFDDNDHVTLHELRGFVSDDLDGAMAETAAIAKGTRCQQPIFSLSLSPPKEASASVENLVDAIDRAEMQLGLDGQPRAIVIHEKNGRRHAHCVWGRITPEMKAINLPFFKAKLSNLSRELYLEHGWDLPEGHLAKDRRNPLNFTLAEWQQAQRAQTDPRLTKAIFRSAWARSDSLASFKNGLEQHGYFLAEGDRRGVVALSVYGDVYSVKRWAGVQTSELKARMEASPKLDKLEKVRTALGERLRGRALEALSAARAVRDKELKPHNEEIRILASHHRKERSVLADKQEERRTNEARERASRLRSGLGIVMDILTGKLFAVKRQNELETYECALRDREQREILFRHQLKERQELQRRKELLLAKQRDQRRSLIRTVLAFTGRGARGPNGPDLGRGI